MELYSTPALKLDDDVSFSKVTIDELERAADDVDEELLKNSIETKLIIRQSIEYSKTFHCSHNLNKRLVLGNKNNETL